MIKNSNNSKNRLRGLELALLCTCMVRIDKTHSKLECEFAGTPRNGAVNYSLDCNIGLLIYVPK